MENTISQRLHPVLPGSYNTTASTPTPQRVVTIFVCSLSVIGSLLIILSFCCGRKLRTKLRSYVLFISLMDIMYSLANLVGASIDFQQYVNRTRHGGWRFDPPQIMNDVCIAQGVFATYGTLASIYWTVCMAVYLYFGVLCYLKERYEHMLQVIYYSSHVISWLLPLYITAWALGEEQMTYSPWGSFGGWCTAFGIRNRDNTKSNIRLIAFMRSDYSTLSTSALILVFCTATFSILSSKERAPSIRGHSNLKLISIPLVFIFLRLWSTLVACIYLYPHTSNEDMHVPEGLQYLSAIGDSSQGFFNFIIYCILTKRVRQIMCWKVKSLMQRSWSTVQASSPPL